MFRYPTLSRDIHKKPRKTSPVMQLARSQKLSLCNRQRFFVYVMDHFHFSFRRKSQNPQNHNNAESKLTGSFLSQLCKDFIKL